MNELTFEQFLHLVELQLILGDCKPGRFTGMWATHPDQSFSTWVRRAAGRAYHNTGGALGDPRVKEDIQCMWHANKRLLQSAYEKAQQEGRGG